MVKADGKSALMKQQTKWILDHQGPLTALVFKALGKERLHTHVAMVMLGYDPNNTVKQFKVTERECVGAAGRAACAPIDHLHDCMECMHCECCEIGPTWVRKQT